MRSTSLSSETGAMLVVSVDLLTRIVLRANHGVKRSTIHGPTEPAKATDLPEKSLHTPSNP